MTSENVHVTAYYTDSARKANFVVEQSAILQHVINEAYSKLEESHRDSDTYFCHGGVPREPLTPYLNDTLSELKKRGICIHDDGRGELEFAFDIDTKQGGA